MNSERRKYPRVKARVPVEIYVEGSDTPIRGATSDISLNGCYIESIFPFPKGATLDLKLQLGDTLLIVAIVATSDPQVGNGVLFTRMLPEDVDTLRTYIESRRAAG
jgi:PilZ domain